MSALLALAPILLIVALMVGLRWSAVAAGAAGLAATLAIALFGFGYGSARLSELGPTLAVAGALTEALFVAGTIIWIVFPALCIYELQLSGGAFEIFRGALARLSDDPRILAVLVAWFFALFLEGAAGFGAPVAIAAPVLVGLGFPPVTSVTLVLIGHAAGVSFGAIGTPVLPQIAVTGFTGPELARATGLMHASLGWILLVFVFRLAGRAISVRSGLAEWLRAGAAAACFLVPYLLLSQFVGPELPTIGGALVGGVVFAALLRWERKDLPRAAAAVGGGCILRAALPYLVLLAVILASRLIPPAQEGLRSVQWAWSLPGGFGGSVQPLYHPGTMLLIGFLAGGLLQRRRARALGSAALRAGRRLPLVLAALAAMLGLARLMVHSGMVAALAEAAADLFGPVWPLVAPAVGVLGTFVTGSATASNIMLTDFQEAAAGELALPVLWLVAAQGFGAAVGNIVCPHNIIAGAATVGIQGREGEVLRHTALACAVYALAGGGLIYVLATWSAGV